MTEQHPITPPPELVRKWAESPNLSYMGLYRHIATQAARWGADQQLKLDAEQIAQAYTAGADAELEACCEWLGSIWPVVNVPIDELRAARRPKPPSLKEQALDALDEAILRGDCITTSDALPIIRRALEQLND